MFKTISKKISQPFLSLLPLALLLNACSSKVSEEINCELPSVGYVNSNQENNQLDIAVNVDGSGSMIGYISVNNSNYIKALDAIESVVDENQTTTVTYKRIGNTNSISRGDFRRDAKSIGFYDGSNPNYNKVSSPIQNAIIPPSEGEDKLTIIVTDLEGDDGDLVSEKLRRDYFNQQIRLKGYTVGVWAVKSQFEGNVYDPNTGKIKFYYSTENKSSQDYRPFYVLFIGKYHYIAEYFDQLKKFSPNLVNDSEMFIFPASNIVKEPINLGSFETREKKIELPENNQLERLYSLEDKDIIIQTKNDDIPYELLEIVHEDQNIISLKYQIPFPTLTENDQGGIYSLAVEENNLKVKTRVFTFSQNKSNSEQIQPEQSQLENGEAEPQLLKNKEQLNPQNSPSENQGKKFFRENSNLTLQNALTLQDLTLTNENQTLQFITNINLDYLVNPQIYLFEVDLILDNMEDLDWWQNWDSKKITTEQDGSKTHNISLFMHKLEQLSLDSIRDQDNNAVIGRLCFALHKN